MIQTISAKIPNGYKVDLVVIVDEFGNSTEAEFKILRLPGIKQIELDAMKIFSARQKYVFNYKLIGFKLGVDYIINRLRSNSE